MKTNESDSDIDRKLIIFRIKIYYWVASLIYSIVFVYIAGIDFRAVSFPNKWVEALLSALVFGIFLVYVNIFHMNYRFRDRLLSSFLYIFCLSMTAFFYKSLIYSSGRIDHKDIAPIILMVFGFPIYIIMAENF
jgi:hypothetical protein